MKIIWKSFVPPLQNWKPLSGLTADHHHYWQSLTYYRHRHHRYHHHQHCYRRHRHCHHHHSGLVFKTVTTLNVSKALNIRKGGEDKLWKWRIGNDLALDQIAIWICFWFSICQTQSKQNEYSHFAGQSFHVQTFLPLEPLLKWKRAKSLWVVLNLVQ